MFSECPVCCVCAVCALCDVCPVCAQCAQCVPSVCEVYVCMCRYEEMLSRERSLSVEVVAVEKRLDTWTMHAPITTVTMATSESPSVPPAVSAFEVSEQKQDYIYRTSKPCNQ